MAFNIVICFALIAAASAVALPQEYDGQQSAPIVEDYTEQTPKRQPYISAFRDDQQSAPVQVQQPYEYTYLDAQPQPDAGHVLQQREVQIAQPLHSQVVYPKQDLTVHNSQYQEEEHNGPAEYEFAYSVHDEKTGDIKQQKESRHGDAVVGEYSLVEPDGHLRTVKYSSDKHTGFVAEVSRTGAKGYEAPVQQKASYY